jgi:hypothetical protein
MALAVPFRVHLRHLDKLSRPRTALALAALEVVVLAAVNLLDFPLSVPWLRRTTGHAYLDMCAFCSAATIRTELEALGPKGRMAQALLLVTIDVLIPTLSCLFGLSALAALTKPWRDRGATLEWLFALPLLAMLLDFAENATIAVLLIRFPGEASALAALQGLFTGLKFAAYGAVGVAIFGAAITRTARRA